MAQTSRSLAWPLAVVVPVTVAYLATASRHVLGGDNGEFATLFAQGGIAHPSGYPLYTLWLRAFAWLPGVTPAHGSALATALLGAAVAATLYVAGRAWGASPPAAALATVVYATSPRAWGLATEAEVFTLNALVAVAIVAVAAPGGALRGPSRTAALGLLAGMGLANHLTVVFMAPIGLDGALRGIRESTRRVRTALLGVTALVPGLLTYGSLVVTARHPAGRWIWADTRTLGPLVRHILRADYGTGQLSTHGGAPQPVAQLLALGTHLARDLLGLPAVLGAVAAGMAVVHWARTPGGPSTGDARETVHAARSQVALVLSLLLAGPVFASRINVATVGVGGAIGARFHLLPAVLLAVWAARGVDTLVTRWQVSARVMALAVAALGLTGVAATLPDVMAAHGSTLEDYVRDTLDTAPPHAVLLGTGDHRQLGVLYAQHALGVRRDVLYIDPYLLLLPTQRARIERALGHPLPPLHGRTVDTLALAETVLATGRPLLLTNVFTPVIVQSLPGYPLGTLIRVLPAGTRPPTVDALVALNEHVAAGYRVTLPDGTVEPWCALAYEDYARPWQVLAQAMAARGDTVRAAVYARRAAALGQ